MLFFSFLAAARKIARLPEKNYFARLWGWAAAPPQPLGSYAYAHTANLVTNL